MKSTKRFDSEDEIHDKLINTNSQQSSMPIMEMESKANTSLSSSFVTAITTTTSTIPSVQEDYQNIATYNAIQQRHIFDREKINLESHQLVWLDPTVDRNQESDALASLENLRKIVDYTKLFNNVEQCQQFIEQTKVTTTFITTSDDLGEQLVSNVYNLKNVYSIYIYNTTNNYQQEWISNYSKIKQVYSNIEQLLNELKDDVDKYLNHDNETIFGKIRQENTTDGFMSLLVDIVDIFCYLPYPEDCRRKFIETLREYYNGKEAELAVLKNFEQDYRSDKAIWWYTRDNFVHRLLNRALRQQNIEVLFLFGFFIQDIYQQLKHKRSIQNLDGPSIVYRGQFISRDEINKIKECDYDTASSIVNNSFFSATTNRDLALLFTNQSQPDDEIQCVLFEIEIDARLKSRSYADITALSNFPDESEILFMITTYFEIEPDDVKYDDDKKIWIVKLNLANDDHVKDDREFKSVSKRKTLKNCVSIFEDVLYKQSSDVRITIFNELINLYPLEKWLFDMKDYYLRRYPEKHIEEIYASVLSTRSEVLTMWFEYINDAELNCYVDVGKIYKGIGDCYPDELDDKNAATKHYDLAIEYFEAAIEHTATDYEKIQIFDLLSDVYKSKMEISNDEKEQIHNCSLVIHHVQLSIEKLLVHRSSDYCGIANRREELANFQQAIYKYDDALTNYEEAIKVYMKQFEPNLCWIKATCEKIIRIYCKHKDAYNSALEYQLMKHDCTLKINASKPKDYMSEIVASHVELADLYVALHQYVSAKEQLMAIMKLYQESKLFSKKEITAVKEKLDNLHKQLDRCDLDDEHLTILKNLYQEVKSDLQSMIADDRSRNKSEPLPGLQTGTFTVVHRFGLFTELKKV
ncbi:unnamed protein product [Rotaria socialis]|uniref:Uncharacterized protein n=1 Tax=Rotaria socialis TaxID=392032 RepID=A0A817Y2Y0_9BILA|nr:unnamed protein product [Rotaria socialis]CAF4455928.1 unnamed protein product [Rotaria socialis]